MRINLTLRLDRERAALAGARRAIDARHGEALELLGVRTLSLALGAFDVKSRGGTGSDDITWAPLAASTVARKSRRGRRNANRRRTRSGKARPTGNATVIGVDTGLLRSSASPGFQGSDGRGGNVLSVNVAAGQVTVGFGRSYADHFDERRPLMPETLTPYWRGQLELTYQQWAESILDEPMRDV